MFATFSKITKDKLMKKIVFIVLILLSVAAVFYLVVKSDDVSEPNVSKHTLPQPLLTDTTPQPFNSNIGPDASKGAIEADDGANSAVAKNRESGQQGNESDENRVNIQDNPTLSIASFLVDEGENVVLETQVLETLSVNELRHVVNNLNFEGSKDNLAFEVEYKLERKLREISGNTLDTVRCSNTICGLIFSSDDKKTKASTLNQLSSDAELGALSRGGLIRSLEDGGFHYGVLIVVLDNGRPLQLQSK